MRSFWSVLILLMSTSVFAGSFKDYTWRTSFRMGGGHYQPTLKISYTYDGNSSEDFSSLAVPRDANLSVQKLVFKVDGKKVEALEDNKVTWWSNGEEVPVYLPPSGKKIKGEALFVVKNIFLIPPAPTNLPIPVKKLEGGFAPLGKFEFSGSFIGKQQKFKGKKIPAKEGEPSGLQAFSVKNAKANGGDQGLFYLVPKNFTFSFNLLRGAQQNANQTTAQGNTGSLSMNAAGGANAGAVLGGIGTQAGAAGSGDADINTSDLKPYSMKFYTQKPTRDWQYAPTWLQQEYTYLPFGILPGGRVQSRTLFKGAGDKTGDLIPWIDPPKKGAGDAAPASSDGAAPYQAIDLFLKDWRASVKIDQDLSTMIASSKDDVLSPAMANKVLATELHQRFKLSTAPVLTTRHEAKLAPSLPLSAFHGVLTGVEISGRWFILDAATSTWDLRSAGEHLKGKNAIILADRLQMATF